MEYIHKNFKISFRLSRTGYPKYGFIYEMVLSFHNEIQTDSELRLWKIVFIYYDLIVELFMVLENKFLTLSDDLKFACCVYFFIFNLSKWLFLNSIFDFYIQNYGVSN